MFVENEILMDTYCGIIFLYTMKICPSDWFNKEADEPIAEHNMVKWGSQTEKAVREKKGRAVE